MSDVIEEIAESLSKNPVDGQTDADAEERTEVQSWTDARKAAAEAMKKKVEEIVALAAVTKPTGAPPHLRRKLPDERQSLTHKFSLAGHDGYIIVGLYADGTPGEVFISIAKEGSTVSGLFDTLGICVSMALQSGVPLEVLCNKLCGSKFEPYGWTENPAIPEASSIVDYVFKWLRMKFLKSEQG